MKRITKITIIISIIVLFAAIIAVTIFAYKNRQKLAQTIAVKPEPFTELYFENNEHLPTKEAVIKDFQHVAYTFSFTIHNEENADMQYPYKVSMTGDANEVIDNKSVFLKKNESKTITETFYLSNIVPIKTKIEVNLTQKNQQIDFWMGGTQ